MWISGFLMGITENMHRRDVIAASSLAFLSSLAGCLRDDSGDDHEGDAPPASDLSEETQLLAGQIADAVEEEREIDQWRFARDLYIIEFYGEFPPDDIPILARAYAEGVADGFSYRSMPTAINETGGIEYMVYIELEWAESYNAGEMSAAEFHDEIAETIH